MLRYASPGVHRVLAIVQRRQMVVLGEGVDLRQIPVPRVLAGRRLTEVDIGGRTGLNVIAVQSADRQVEMVSPEVRLEIGTVLIALGSTDEREQLREPFGHEE